MRSNLRMNRVKLTELAKNLTRTAICGVTKNQLLRNFKEAYDLSDEEIEKILQFCNFNKEPDKIDYEYFYNNPIEKKAEKIEYPFTQIYAYKNFHSDQACSKLIECINKSTRKSTLANDNDEALSSDYRTSQTADLHFFPEELIIDIDEKLENFMELDRFLGEALQAQKYNPGEYYKEHWDFFPPRSKKQYKVYCEWMGQRTWTTMMYLNDVSEGGETYFKHLKLKVKPERGLLLAWNNLYRNGKPNYKTMHEALPPLKEDKYVITKWWRSWTLI